MVVPRLSMVGSTAVDDDSDAGVEAVEDETSRSQPRFEMWMVGKP